MILAVINAIYGIALKSWIFKPSIYVGSEQLGHCHSPSLLPCVAAGCVTKSRYSPSAQRLPKACSDTPRMDTRIFVSISDWLVSYAPYNWSYSCKISKYKYCHVHIVFSFKARPCFAFEKVEKAMSDSSGQGTKLRLIQSPMRLKLSCWRPRFKS